MGCLVQLFSFKRNALHVGWRQRITELAGRDIKQHSFYHTGTGSSPCSLENRNSDPAPCLSAINSDARNNTLFWYGTSYAARCPNPYASMDCFNSAPFRADSILSRVFGANFPQDNLVTKFVDVTFTTGTGTLRSKFQHTPLFQKKKKISRIFMTYIAKSNSFRFVHRLWKYMDYVREPNHWFRPYPVSCLQAVERPKSTCHDVVRQPERIVFNLCDRYR